VNNRRISSFAPEESGSKIIDLRSRGAILGSVDDKSLRVADAVSSCVRALPLPPPRSLPPRCYAMTAARADGAVGPRAPAEGGLHPQVGEKMTVLRLGGSRGWSAAWVMFAVAWAVPATLGGGEQPRASWAPPSPGLTVLVPRAGEGFRRIAFSGGGAGVRLRGGGDSCVELCQRQESPPPGAAGTDGAAETTQVRPNMETGPPSSSAHLNER